VDGLIEEGLVSDSESVGDWMEVLGEVGSSRVDVILEIGVSSEMLVFLRPARVSTRLSLRSSFILGNVNPSS